jgi:hypothetical protein
VSKRNARRRGPSRVIFDAKEKDAIVHAFRMGRKLSEFFSVDVQIVGRVGTTPWPANGKRRMLVPIYSSRNQRHGVCSGFDPD